MKTNNRAEMLKSSIPHSMLLQIHNKKVMNSITLAEYRNIIAMQKLLIDLKNVRPVKAGEAQKIVLATRLRMKRAIEQN